MFFDIAGNIPGRYGIAVNHAAILPRYDKGKNIMSDLSNLTLAAMIDLYNGAIDDYAPMGCDTVNGFKSKAEAVKRINAMCDAGNLAITFDGDKAIIVDATPIASDSDADADADADTDADTDTDVPEHGDGKGGIAPSGFTYASEAWLKAHPRGTPEREAYRKARKLAGRKARSPDKEGKASRANELAAKVAALEAKLAALDTANAVAE